jgi:hypothetical protein
LRGDQQSTEWKSELLRGVSPSEDERSNGRRQERRREGPTKAPSEARERRAPSEGRPARMRGREYS